MRVLLITWNATAHLPAMVPLAWAFVAAGHDVLVAAPPADAASARAWGLTAVAVGPDPATPPPPAGGPPPRWPRGWQRDPGLLDEAGQAFLAKLAAKQRGLAAAMLPDLVELAKTHPPELIVHDASSLAGPVLAARLGVPVAGHSWGEVSPIRPHHDARGVATPEYAALFGRFDAAVPAGAAVELDPCPPALRLPGSATARREDVRAVPRFATVPTAPARPRVAVLVEGASDPLRALPETLDDVDVVLAERGGLVIPWCDVLVHHGSGAALLTAAAAGVPQLVFSVRPEQQTAGEQVARAVAGIHHCAADRPPLRVLRESVRELVTDSRFRFGAEAVAASARAAPSPAEVAERLTSRG